MDSSDIYYTISQSAESQIREKMSLFISFAHPVGSRDEIQAIIKQYANKYHDARHVCWAWMLGEDCTEWMLSDNGEPSGTAGKPILGQIHSRTLTDVLVVVVRYFGGIKLGTSGLIQAYRQAASQALDAAGRKECCKTVALEVTCPYQSADGVMKVVKNLELGTLDRKFDNTCTFTLAIPRSRTDEVCRLLGKVSGTCCRVKTTGRSSSCRACSDPDIKEVNGEKRF